MTSRATIGERCISKIPMVTNQGFKSFICRQINNEFLYYLIEINIEKFKRLSGGSTFLELSKKTIENFEIPYPSIPEQKAIVQILNTADKEVELLEKELEYLKEQKKGLMQNLLTGKIRVKI